MSDLTVKAVLLEKIRQDGEGVAIAAITLGLFVLLPIVVAVCVTLFRIAELFAGCA